MVPWEYKTYPIISNQKNTKKRKRRKTKVCGGAVVWWVGKPNLETTRRLHGADCMYWMGQGRSLAMFQSPHATTEEKSCVHVKTINSSFT